MSEDEYFEKLGVRIGGLKQIWTSPRKCHWLMEVNECWIKLTTRQMTSQRVFWNVCVKYFLNNLGAVRARGNFPLPKSVPDSDWRDLFNRVLAPRIIEVGKRGE